MVNVSFEEQCESVDEFADRMKEKLEDNIHKHHWSDLSRGFLLERLIQEVGELVAEISKDGIRTPEAIADEAADIANFAMMIADNALKDRI